MAGDGERVVQGGGFGSGVGADCQPATGQGYVAVDSLDFVVVEFVGRDIRLMANWLFANVVCIL